ncbi:P-II family nitrogen regulator [Lacrimispora defluvii]|uniref:P-II family nitrogen regulator n=1 Tax=Lacrimispora defluvii TaxID=2719233 RepID=A0ABX1VMW7_9FIRM|nr:P-II family nitrogen regulator [Lacrimispora defluvii]NNJ28626.1 P-II family nitrogen regulator [Lacrimispora defluvii]
MKMIQAIIRPEKVSVVLEQLALSGFHAATKNSVLGRGKQQGIIVGGVHYDEVLKECVTIVIEDSDFDTVVGIISRNSRTGEKGNFGDGKIFVLPVERAFTISTGEERL